MKEIKKIINQQLKAIGINYAFMRWNKEPIYPYFVGEYNEPERTVEDQYSEPTFILTGFTRGSWAELEEATDKIKKLFTEHRARLENGLVIIYYAGSFPIPIDEGELKKIQINLKIKDWRVT